MGRGFAGRTGAPARMARFDPARILRASHIKVGKVRVSGVPAILLGASAIVFTAGAMRMLRSGALPEALREATKLIDALRNDRADQRRLNP
jgi:hypothetical protein